MSMYNKAPKQYNFEVTEYHNAVKDRAGCRVVYPAIFVYKFCMLGYPGASRSSQMKQGKTWQFIYSIEGSPDNAKQEPSCRMVLLLIHARKKKFSSAPTLTAALLPIRENLKPATVQNLEHFLPKYTADSHKTRKGIQQHTIRA